MLEGVSGDCMVCMFCDCCVLVVGILKELDWIEINASKEKGLCLVETLSALILYQ